MADNRGPQMVAVTILFLVLMWTTVSLRCWVRLKIINAFAIDDWLAVLTLCLMSGYSVLVFAAVKAGCGHHERDLSTEQKVEIMRLWFYGELFYIINTAVVRVAVATFLLRVAAKRAHRLVIFTLTGVNILFNTYYFFFTIFQCSPVSGFWTRYQRPGIKCHANISAKSTLAASGIAAIIDWVFGLLPVLILWEANLNFRKKCALALVMGLGAVASTAPLVRIPYTISLEHTTDFIYETMDVAIWSFIEPSLALTAISLAVLRPLFRSLRNRTGSDGSILPMGPPPSKLHQVDDTSHDTERLALYSLPSGHHTVTIEGGHKKQLSTKLTKARSFYDSDDDERTLRSTTRFSDRDDHYPPTRGAK